MIHDLKLANACVSCSPPPVSSPETGEEHEGESSWLDCALGRLRRRAIVEHLGKRAQAANRVALFGNVATQQGPRLSID